MAGLATARSASKPCQTSRHPDLRQIGIACIQWPLRAMLYAARAMYRWRPAIKYRLNDIWMYNLLPFALLIVLVIPGVNWFVGWLMIRRLRSIDREKLTQDSRWHQR